MPENLRNIVFAAIFVAVSAALLRNGAYVSWVCSLAVITILIFDRNRLPVFVRNHCRISLIVSLAAMLASVPLVF